MFKWVVLQEWEASASALFGVVLGIGSTAVVLASSITRIFLRSSRFVMQQLHHESYIRIYIPLVSNVAAHHFSM